VELDCGEADWREYRPDLSFELVVISFMHPGPGERAAMFARAGEMLVAGGHLVVVGVDLAEHGRRGPPNSERLYTPDRMPHALEGFDLRRCESVGYEAESKGGRRRVVDVVAIARRPP